MSFRGGWGCSRSVSRPAYDLRCYRLPPHKQLPSREALVLWIGLQPFRQVADIWTLRPADYQPNPCGTPVSTPFYNFFIKWGSRRPLAQPEPRGEPAEGP